VDKSTLFGRLAEGHAARITVVTPNRRLSQALVSELDAYQAAQGKTVWEAADILPFDAFVQRAYEDALYADLSAEVPPLLTAAQEQMLWVETIQSSRAGRELLAVQQTAEQCRKAWRLAHAWRIGEGQGNQDAQAFNEWSSSYRKKTAGEADAARLPDLILKLLKYVRTPRLLVPYAFDILPPQTREFFDALASQGVEVLPSRPEKRAGSVSRTSFSSPRDELDSAARWARARLENRGQSPISPRIGVVVPDLQQRRKEVVRVFSRVMQPAFNLPGAVRSPMPFNVSLGLPLDQYPVVALALSLLELSNEEIPFETASRLIRSPFIGGAEKELAARARLEVKLRKSLGAAVSLPKLIANVQGAPLLRALLEKLFAARPAQDLFSEKAPSDWARQVSGLLEAAGFPGERALDSEEYQVRAKWHEVLGELAKLDRVAPQLSFLQALATLKRLCGETLFQPETTETPIQVLGILESAGMEFDHLWVSGLTDEAWPLDARANPFLPVALQKKAGIPEASAEGSLALDRSITAHWMAAAGEVIFSFHEKDEDRELTPSPLIPAVAQQKIDLPDLPRLRDLIFSKRTIAAIEDRVAPPVTATQVRGGTRVLSDQAACPFRAFARWRLAAEPLEAPADGLDAAKRGSLLHALMKHLWSSLKDSASLERDTAPAIEAAAAAAVKDLALEARLSPRFAELERARLARLAREWLEVERSRAPFEVVALEKPQAFRFSGVEFSGRIDRMDRLVGSKEAGGHVLIDYKTSANPTPKHWEPPRPHDPQLPLYAVTAKEEIAAVAFAKVRPGEMRFMGFSKDEKTIEGVKKAKAWEPLLRSWKAEAESLGAAFASGEARVDPKRELQTCRHCGLQTLCRVYEKVNVLSEGEEGEE
jgi:ATP-dependent helicase/nuclease subunit B